MVLQIRRLSTVWILLSMHNYLLKYPVKSASSTLICTLPLIRHPTKRRDDRQAFYICIIGPWSEQVLLHARNMFTSMKIPVIGADWLLLTRIEWQESSGSCDLCYWRTGKTTKWRTRLWRLVAWKPNHISHQSNLESEERHTARQLYYPQPVTIKK